MFTAEAVLRQKVLNFFINWSCQNPMFTAEAVLRQFASGRLVNKLSNPMFTAEAVLRQ